MANTESSKQQGNGRSGKDRQHQGEQSYEGQQGSAQQGSPAGQVEQTTQMPARQGSQSLQRHDSFYRSDPFAMFQQLSDQMDEMFDSLFSGRPRRSRQIDMPTLWSPEVDIREENNRLRVCIDLPGIPKDAVKVDIHDGALTVQGERSEESSDATEGKKGFRRSERRYGSFYRSIPLPEGADAENAQANMKEGVLEITIPLPERKQARRLEIQS
jgi:HSP20 family protein